jgi:hypothetical protein
MEVIGSSDLVAGRAGRRTPLVHRPRGRTGRTERHACGAAGAPRRTGRVTTCCGAIGPAPTPGPSVGDPARAWARAARPRERRSPGVPTHEGRCTAPWCALCRSPATPARCSCRLDVAGGVSLVGHVAGGEQQHRSRCGCCRRCPQADRWVGLGEQVGPCGGQRADGFLQPADAPDAAEECAGRWWCPDVGDAVQRHEYRHSNGEPDACGCAGPRTRVGRCHPKPISDRSSPTSGHLLRGAWAGAKAPGRLTFDPAGRRGAGQTMSGWSHHRLLST